jgi:DHA1 family bicyclomycin/chloramphenicol resistance-like MFS transporter
MAFSALVGAGIGTTLGGSALPLPLAMSGVALAAALVFLALRRMRRRSGSLDARR